ncbi:MAG: trypsin-like peptidase domain-containing protein [Elusimicrobia bacterium]|nr:trypsin-like peptidase domain-containing protein [Elusimicrobiota bacterium]
MNELKEKYSKLTDDELLTIVYVESSDYTEEAIKVAKIILDERGIGYPSEETISQTKKTYQESKKIEENLKYKDVGGWLLFFCISLTIINPLYNLVEIINMLKSFTVFVFIGSIFDIGLSIYGIYAGMSLWKIRPHAVKTAKRFLLVSLIYVVSITVLLIILGIINEEFIKIATRSVVYFIIWYSYLSKSKRVKETYGLDSIPQQNLPEENTEKEAPKQCPKCGAKNDEDSEFCINCGEKINLDITIETVQNKPERSDTIGIKKPGFSFKRYIKQWKFITIGVVVVLIIGLWYIIPPSSSSIFEKEKNKIVSIVSSKGLLKSPIKGTGFVIGPSGKIATNYHIICGAYKCSIKFLNGESYDEVNVLAVDAKRDIAILQINALHLLQAKLGNSAKVKTGNKCYVIGNPLGFERVISDGIVSNIVHSEQGYTSIQITAPVSEGNSGGPVYDRRGRVIGIATSSVKEGQNLNFAVPINYVKPLLLRKKREISLKEYTKNDANAYLYAGLEEMVCKNYSTAINQFYKAYEMDSTLTEACYMIGLTYILNKDFKVAKNWLKYYIKLEQNNSENISLVSTAEKFIKEMELNEKEQQIKLQEEYIKLFGY